MIFIKYKDYYTHLLREATLSGSSRSAGIPNWDLHIVNDFDKKRKYNIEKDGKLYDKKFQEIGVVKKGNEIQILSPKLTKHKVSKFANISIGGKGGFVNISMIQKPTTSKEGSVIGGGTNSKEFTPDKLKLQGIKYSSSSSMISKIKSGLNSQYSDSKYREIKKYLSECLSKSSGTNISLYESFTKSYSLSGKYNVSDGDISILSKNFGEVLAGLYILVTNKKAQTVEFPSNISETLYDFTMTTDKGIKHFYSVKSQGGSSTALGNINYVLDKFSKDNKLFSDHKKEIEVIRGLINDKQSGKTTICNITDLYNKILSTKKKQILNSIKKISKYKPKDLSQTELSKWFPSMVSTAKINDFINTMNDIYNSILDKSKVSEKKLRQMYNGKGIPNGNGYLLYPMGSYIVKYLNNDKKYLDLLNTILNYGSYVHQFTATLAKKNFKVTISSFKTSKFRYTYNAGGGYPGNRPIGFKKGS